MTITVANYPALPVEALVDEYERVNPGVVVEVVDLFEGASSYRPTLLDDLSSGAELADVVAASDDDLGTILGDADRFTDLRDHGLDAGEGGMVPWAWQRGTDHEGRILALPATIAPAGLCFRGDLLAGAGIAQNREELATLLSADGGDWDVYFDLGRRYRTATGRAWFDQPELIWQAMSGQLPYGYSAPGRGTDVASDLELRARWDLLAAAVADGLSAHQDVWDWSGGRSFVDGTFATFPCSNGMLALIEAQVTAAGGEASTGWDVADVFPGGGWAWGGTYLAVAATSAHADEAAALVAWLTAPAQQARFHASGIGIPSDRWALAALAADTAPHPFFDDAPVGPIFASRAQDVPCHVVGPEDLRISAEVFGPALSALDDGVVDGPTAWADAMARLADFGP